MRVNVKADDIGGYVVLTDCSGSCNSHVNFTWETTPAKLRELADVLEEVMNKADQYFNRDRK